MDFTYSKSMKEDATKEERPTKHRRVASSSGRPTTDISSSVPSNVPPHAAEPHLPSSSLNEANDTTEKSQLPSPSPSQSALQLQSLIRQLGQVPLSRYVDSNRVDDIVHQITSHLEHNQQHQQQYEYRLLAQVHGLLLQWLDYIVTSSSSSLSSHKMRSVQDIEDLMTKGRTSVSIIAKCLHCVHQTSQKWPLQSPNATFILIRALLHLCQRQSQQLPRQQPNTEDNAMSESLANLIVALHFAIPNASFVTGSDNGHCEDALPRGVQVEFLLCLVDAWNAGEVDMSTAAKSSIPIEVAVAPPPHVVTGQWRAKAATAARNILFNLLPAAALPVEPRPEGGDTTTVTPFWSPSYARSSPPYHQPYHCHLPSFVSEYAEIAWTVLHETKPFVAVSASVTSKWLFRMQCLLRKKQVLQQDELLNVVDILSTLPNKESVCDLMQYQAVDCLVTIARCHLPVTNAAPASPLQTKILLALMKTLTGSAALYDVASMLKAVEGLQFVLVSDEQIHMCIAILTSEKSSPPYTAIKAFVTSLMEAIHCCSRSRYHHHAETYESNERSGNMVAQQQHWLDWTVDTHNVAVAACEILLSVLCASFPEVSQSMSQSQLVSICTSLLQIETYGEHIAYLTVRTICHEHADKFVDIVQAYPELLTSLAGVLSDSDASTSTIKFILTFLQNLLEVSPAMATVLVRQTNVLDAVTSVASMHMRSSSAGSSSSGTANIEMRSTATTLLFALSNDVCNRRLLAQQPRALPSMIGFVREYPPTAQQANPVPGGNLGSRAALCYREVWKERILQLAAVL